jgi:hypothetical protein
MIWELQHLQEPKRFFVRKCQELTSIGGRYEEMLAVKEFEGALEQADHPIVKIIDEGLKNLRESIGHVHMGCFGGGGNDPTLLVFQAIETALEELH